MPNIIEIAKGLPPWAILAFGVITGSLRNAWSFLYDHTLGYVITRLTLSLTVEDIEHKQAYLWLSHWVEINLRKRRMNSLLLRKNDCHDEESGKDNSYRLIPEYGTYYLRWRNRLMVISHFKENQPNTRQLRPMHSMRLQIWLAWDRSILLDIIDAARVEYESTQPITVDYYRADQYGDWRLETVAPRSMDSVYLPKEQLDDLTADVHTYLAAKPVYAEMGIPYRRGYQLSGPPGTGKSTIILALATFFKLPVYSVPLRGSEMTGERLADLLGSCRKPAIVALEDVDCLKLTTTRKSKPEQAITMADLLNVIDGIGAGEDRLLFMTANQPEILDTALVRAGRVDRKLYLDYARDEELRRFHLRVSQYFPILPWPEFRSALPQKATIADAQALAFQQRGQCSNPSQLTLVE